MNLSGGILVIALLLPSVCIPSDDPPKRQPVPDEVSKVGPLEDFHEAFKEELERIEKESTKQKKQQHVVDLAVELLEMADDPKENPAARYVYLEMTIELTAEAGCVTYLQEATRRISRYFKVDEIDQTYRALNYVDDKRMPNAEKVLLSKAYLSLAMRAIELDRYNDALKAIDKSISYAGSAKNKTRESEAVHLKTKIKALDKAHKSLEKARKVYLEKISSWGKSLCLEKGDWEQGLGILASCSESPYQDLASHELTLRSVVDSEKGKEILSLIDGWMNAAKKERKPSDSWLLYLHAFELSHEALSVLSGTDRKMIEDRIDKLVALAKELKVEFDLPVGAELVMTFGSKNKDRVPDLSGNGNTGLLTDAEIKKGIAGNGLHLTGVGESFLKIADSGSLHLNDFTISLWIKPKKKNRQGHVIAKSVTKNFDVAWRNSFAIVITKDTFQIGMTPGGPWGGIGKKVGWQEWQHVILVKDGTKGVFYVNGLVEKIWENLSKSIPYDDSPLWIGTDDNGGDKKADPGVSYAGVIDEVAIWNRPLSQSEVGALRFAGLCGKELR